MNLQVIISGCKNRDLKSERELYYLFARKVFGLAKKYTHDTQEAEDLMQECFIRVFSQIQRYDDDKGKFESWIYRVSVNVILQSLRTKKSQLKSVPIDFIPELKAEDTEYQEISSVFMEQAIQELPNGYKEIFNLYVVQKWSHKEIAHHLKITEGTSRSQLTKAKKYLRHFIQSNSSQLYERKQF